MPVFSPSFQYDAKPETVSRSFSHSLHLDKFHHVWFFPLAVILVAGARYIAVRFLYTASSAYTGGHYSAPTPLEPLPHPPPFYPADEKRSDQLGIHGISSKSNMAPSSPTLGLDAEGQSRCNEVTHDAKPKSKTEAERRHNILPSSPSIQQPYLPASLASPTAFNFDHRRRSVPALDTDAFIHQPNPDYTNSNSSAATSYSSAATAASAVAIPKRRSYTKAFDSDTANGHGGDGELVSNSFPSSLPYLPPNPEFPGTGGGSWDQVQGLPVQQQHVVHGKIVSALDNEGYGWKRHTRVYGGGVCLACLHSGGEAGFYGENVRPEDKR